jgi:uncharacterized protein
MGGPRLSGSVTARFQLRCQRCLEEFELGFDQPLAVCISPASGAGTASSRGGEQDDEVLCEPGDRLDLHALIEDEIILALPLSPRCERPGCEPGGEGVPPLAGQSSYAAGASDDGEVATDGDAGQGRKEHPFAVLAVLKERSRGESPGRD